MKKLNILSALLARLKKDPQFSGGIDDEDKLIAIFYDICEEVFAEYEKPVAENLRKLIEHKMEKKIKIRHLVKLLTTETAGRSNVGYGDGLEFDARYGTKTNIILRQYEMPEEMSLERIENSAEYVAAPVSSVQFMLDTLKEQGIRYEDHVFIDVGAGMGRNLLIASEYPFKKIMGVEISNYLTEIAQENIKKYNSTTQKCKDIEAFCMDALKFKFPEEDMIMYFWLPFGPELSKPFIEKLLDHVEETNVNVTLIFLQGVFPVIEDSRKFNKVKFDTTNQPNHGLSIDFYQPKKIRNEKAYSYWLNKYKVARKSTYLEAFKPGTEEHKKRRHAEFTFPSVLSKQLAGLAKNKDFNIYKLGLTALSLVFGKYTNQQDLFFSSPAINLGAAASRYSAMLFEQIAYAPSSTPRQLLKKIHLELEHCIANQKYDFRDFASEYIDNTQLSKLFYAIGYGYEGLNKKAEELDQMGLLFWLSKSGQDFKLSVSTHNAAYSNAFVDRVSAHFMESLAFVCKNLDASFDTFQLLDETQVETIRQFFNFSDEVVFSSGVEQAAAKGYPLSPAQNRMFLVQQMDERTTAYNIPFASELDRDYSLEELNAAFSILIDRHDSLRTSFEMRDGKALQLVHEKVQLQIEEYEGMDQEVLKKTFARPFDLSKAPLLRVGYLKNQGQLPSLLIDLHHIITDEAAQKVLGEELMALLMGESLPPVKLQYKDYVAWLNTDKQQAVMKQQQAYWDQTFAKELSFNNLPLDYPRPDFQTYNGAYTNFLTTDKEFQILSQLTSRHGVSMYVLILSIWNILMAKITDAEDVVVGTAIAGRRHPDLARIVGMFVNTLPIRNTVNSEERFTDFLLKVKENFINVFENQEYPFEKIVEKHWDSSIPGRHPIFDTVIGLFNREEESDAHPSNAVEIRHGEKEIVSKFDLSLAAIDYGDSMSFTFTYNTNLFEPATIERIAQYFRLIIQALEKEDQLRLADIDMVSPKEQLQLEKFNDTKIPYPATETLVSIFEKQVEENPDQVALIHDGAQFSYQQLNEKANLLANYLIHHYDIKPDDRVGLMIDRSAWSVISVLGILKAGAAYVPVEMDYPADRKKFIIEDTQIKALLIHSDTLLEVLDLEVEIFSVDIQLDEIEEAAWKENVELDELTAQNLAYVMYTSGSTGRPKGVLINHQAILRLVFNPSLDFLNQEAVIYHYAPLAFDASTFEIWGAFLKGGTLVVSGAGKKTLEAIEEEVKREKVNILWLTAGLFHLAVDNCIELFADLDYLLAGGDNIYQDRIQTLLEAYDQLTFINAYGPTESTTFATTNRIEKLQDIDTSANIIGKPIGNTQIHILNRDATALMPINAVGEICIAGDGLARGYLNQESLSAEKFIDHPFVEGDKLYKTGDLGRWRANGTIEFLGRMDSQIKIRGYRVELGEIESTIQDFAQVEQCVVIAKEDSNKNKQLIAYLITGQDYDKEQLKTYLKDRLPDYMIPAFIVAMEEFPINRNGKIDRKQLPAPDVSNASASEYIAPSTVTEEYLASIWRDLLGLEKIGVRDNFFELGGHSLSAVKMANQISKVFNVKITLRQIFANLTIAELADCISDSDKETYQKILPAPAMEHYPVSHAQKRLWVTHQLSDHKASYNMPFIEEFNGAIDPELLEKCFEATIDRHEILRTVFKIVDGETRQFVRKLEDLPPVFHFIDLSNEEEKEAKAKQLLEAKVKLVFNLERGPLLKVYLIKVADDQFILLNNFHHIINDGWSTTTFITEIIDRYTAARNGEEYSIEPLAIQYKDFSYWQSEHLLSDKNQSNKKFWLDTLSGELPRIEIPEDQPRPSIKTYNGHTLAIFLDNSVADAIDEIAMDKQASLFMVLLAGLKALLFRYTNIDDAIVGTVVAGREKEELANQLGFYVNMLALRTQFNAEMPFDELIEKVKESVLSAFDHQFYPFDLLLEDLNLQTDPSRSPIFDISFTVQNNSKVEAAPVDQIQDAQSDEFEEISASGSKLDMSFFAHRGEEGLQIAINYNSDIYNEATAQSILAHYKNLLECITENTATAICDIDILKKEKEQLDRFNDTQKDIQPLSAIQAYFERNVEQAPDQLAVIIGDRQFTYQQINEKANQLARWLQANHQAGKEQMVAFMIQNNEWQIISMLGILKSGAGFLPIDPTYPAARIEYILADAKPQVCLIQEALDFSPAGDTEFVNVAALEKDLGTLETTNLESTNALGDVAYMIYTSGSTGNPKGVLNEHKGNINMLKDQVQRFGLQPTDRCLQFASISFDASVYDSLMGLYAGCAVVLLPKGVKDNPSLFVDYLEKHQVTFATLPPAYIASLDRDRLRSLRILVTAGEAPNVEDCKYLSQFLTYYNAYGPTEFSVCTSVYQASGEENSLPIGKPIANTKYYILDSQLNLKPVGFWGDIYISGTGMARGYHNLPDLTDQAFVDHAFEPGAKMYKSGDVGRWLPSGDVVFMGRKDNMVKIRGYRVELAEIEQKINTHPAVREALVIYNNERRGREYLHAYLLTESTYDQKGLVDFLKTELPAYMMPNYFTALDEIPLTQNGKVDYRALPEPSFGQEEKNYKLPQSKLEEELFAIWKEVLGADNFGVDDSFFEVGGQSITGMLLVADIWEKYHYNLKVSDLVRNPTIELLAGLLNQVVMKRQLLLPLSEIDEMRPTIFMVPPILGDSVIYKAIAGLFEKKNLNCMGLQYKGFDSGEDFDHSIEAMADSFLEEILALGVHPNQTLTVMGYSMGAYIAFALVKRLEEEGYRCKLVLLDKEVSAEHIGGETINGQLNVDYLADHLIEIYSRDAALEKLLAQKKQFKAFLAHHIKVHYQFEPKGKVKADILALEAQISNRKNSMESWQHFSEGGFVHENLNTDHFGMLHQELISGIAETVINFTESEIINAIKIK